MENDVELRTIREEDLAILYEHQADPESCRMAAVKPRTREAYLALMEKIRANPDAVNRVVVVAGEVVGSISSWLTDDGSRHIGYSIARQHWGKGYATAALARFLEIATMRPLHASAAKHNVGSLRVLTKNGFVVVREERWPPDERSHEWVDGVELRLD